MCINIAGAFEIGDRCTERGDFGDIDLTHLSSSNGRWYLLTRKEPDLNSGRGPFHDVDTPTMGVVVKVITLVVRLSCRNPAACIRLCGLLGTVSKGNLTYGVR